MNPEGHEKVSKDIPMEKSLPSQAKVPERPFEASESEDLVLVGRTKVFVVVENRLLREILVRLLRRHGYVVLLGKSGVCDTTPKDVMKSDCDVALLDFVDTEWMSEVNRLSASVGHAIKTVALGLDVDSSLFLEAVRCGVMGYLLKDASAADVASVVRAVSRGEVSCPPQLCKILLQTVAQFERHTQIRKPTGKMGLTLRQQALMKLVAKGLTNKEIAEECHLSEYTVKNHVTRILKRLQVGKRSEAVDAIRECGYEIRA